MPNLRPEEGYLPDAVTANKIADAVLVAMFGEDSTPFSGTLFLCLRAISAKSAFYKTF